MKGERKEGNKMETVSLTYAKLQITELINEIKDVPARKKGQKEFIINNSNNIKSIKDKCNEKISVSKGGVLMEHVKKSMMISSRKHSFQEIQYFLDSS